MTDKKMMADFTKSVENTANDVAYINTWTVKATASVVNAIMEADPMMSHERAMIIAVQLVEIFVECELTGDNVFKTALSPAVLGRSLKGDYGKLLEAGIVKWASRQATARYTKRMRAQDEIHAREMLAAAGAGFGPSEKTVGASLGLDLGAYAREMATKAQISDLQAASANKSGVVGEFLENESVADVTQTALVQHETKHGSGRYPAKRMKRVR